jgi:hypothetical protein
MNYAPCKSERELEDQIVTRLTKLGVSFDRQVIASKDDRFDLLVSGGIVLEIKVGGSASELLRQVERYAQFDYVTHIFVITTRAAHRKILSAGPLHGKSVEVLHVGWF